MLLQQILVASFRMISFFLGYLDDMLAVLCFAIALATEEYLETSGSNMVI